MRLRAKGLNSHEIVLISIADQSKPTSKLLLVGQLDARECEGVSLTIVNRSERLCLFLDTSDLVVGEST